MDIDANIVNTRPAYIQWNTIQHVSKRNSDTCNKLGEP